jgi:hypothetical protein
MVNYYCETGACRGNVTLLSPLPAGYINMNTEIRMYVKAYVRIFKQSTGKCLLLISALACVSFVLLQKVIHVSQDCAVMFTAEYTCFSEKVSQLDKTVRSIRFSRGTYSGQSRWCPVILCQVNLLLL